MDVTLWPAVALLALLFLGLEYSGIDLWVQDQFFNMATQQWCVDAAAAGPRFWFYDGPKILIILVGVSLLGLALLPAKWRLKLPGRNLPRRSLWVAFLCIGLVPAVIGQLKAVTNIFCPSEIRRYGGEVPYVKVVECYPEDDRPERRGRCFPAGHASGGFALFALMGFAATRRGQLLGFGLALAIGWSMGLYQMLIGMHYLSHTVVTMMLAWIIFLLLRRAFGLHRRPG